MARQDPQVNIRLPADLRGRLDIATKESGNSLTAEIAARLDRSFATDEAHARLEDDFRLLLSAHRASQDLLQHQARLTQSLCNQLERCHEALLQRELLPKAALKAELTEMISEAREAAALATSSSDSRD
jgi:hypothetical protein